MAKIVYRLIDKVRTVLMVSISSFTIILCFIQIVLRYFTFLNLRPFAWGDEVLRLSAIWVIFLGISMGVRENAHFTVDLFINKIRKQSLRRIADVGIDLVVLALLAILAWKGYVYTSMNVMSSLQNIQISMALFYAAIPVGCLFAILEYVYKLAFGQGYRLKMLSD
jgi:TRAP-type C4-dicarboxylate transport system permease small subunit